MAFCCELAEVRPELIADTAEFRQPPFFRALYGGRIFKAPVNAFSASVENRATFLGVVAHSDDAVEVLPGEFLDRLRALARDVDPELPHNPDSFGAHVGRVSSRAENFVFRTGIVPEQSLRHLAAGRIPGAQYQDSRHLPPEKERILSPALAGRYPLPNYRPRTHCGRRGEKPLKTK